MLLVVIFSFFQCLYSAHAILPQRGDQGCISCGILVSGIRARGVSSEHMENMEMFSCSPTKVRSDSQRTVLRFMDAVDV